MQVHIEPALSFRKRYSYYCGYICMLLDRSSFLFSILIELNSVFAQICRIPQNRVIQLLYFGEHLHCVHKQ